MSFAQSHIIDEQKIQPVLLAPVMDSMQEDENLEPQQVRIREGNSSFLAVDTDQRGLNQSSQIYTEIATDVIFDTRIFKNKVKRIGVAEVRMQWITPNVNERNNVVTFFSSNGGGLHTVVVPEGFYTTPTLLLDALVIALNTATGASGLTFSHLINPLNTITSALSCVGGNYYFDLDCLAIMKGAPLWSLPRSQTLNASKIIGAISLHYTRYVDLVSPDLNRYSKNINASNSNVSSGLVYRLYLDQFKGTPGLTVSADRNIKYFNWNRTNTFSTFRVELLDQFGDKLYVPRFDTTIVADGIVNDSGFFWNIFFEVHN